MSQPSKFADFLASLGLAPKTLDQARTHLDESKAFAAEIGAMFAAAGLDLDAMRAVGPEALKAHLAGLSNDEELAEALLANEQLTAQLATANEAIAAHTAERELHTGFLAAIGFAAKPEAKADEAKAAFEKHVKEAAARELALAGHPPVRAVVAPDVAAAATKDREHFLAYERITDSAERLAYFKKHGEAIYRGSRG